MSFSVGLLFFESSLQEKGAPFKSGMPEVHFIGSIVGASHLPSTASSSFCRWRLVPRGAGCTLLEGSPSGVTQTAAVDFSRGGGSPVWTLSLGAVGAGSGAASVTWEHPIDARFAVSDLADWPQLAVTVWSLDELGRADVLAYGTAFVPVSPGAHRLEIAAWRPEGSWLQELRVAVLGGERPQLVDETLVTDPAAAPRHAIATATTAVVECEVSVVMRGFAEAGVVT